jgi:hypothetical protein
MDDNATPPLPPELAALLAGDSAERTLPVKLPPGRLVRPNPSWVDRSSHASAARPAYWLSDTPAPAALWPQLRAAHPGPACGHCCSKASTPILRCPGPLARSTHNRPA